VAAGSNLAKGPDMALSYDQTKVLIEQILRLSQNEARDILRFRLLEFESREPEFYASVIKHEKGLPFSSDEWFDFLSKIPTRVFRNEPQLMNKLSESQRERLPTSTIG
jgi:hypothetical protein